MPTGIWPEQENICNNLFLFLHYLTSPRPPFFPCKETSIQTQASCFSGTLIHHILGLLAFQIKCLFLDTTCLSVYCLRWGKQYELELSNKKYFYYNLNFSFTLRTSFLQFFFVCVDFIYFIFNVHF